MNARYVWTAAAITLGLAASGCERPAPADAPAGPAPASASAPSNAFRHQLTQDLWGYYLPAAPVVVGDYQLDHVFVGDAAEFAKWEAGERLPTFAPVMLEFAPRDGGEGEGASDSIRVLPTRYEVTDSRIVFVGSHPALGEVRFSATIDGGQLATARRNLGDEETPMTAGVTAAGRTASGVKLAWYGGD